MIPAKIRLLCPQCKEQLSFNEFAGWNERLLECPRCHYRGAGKSFYLRQQTPLKPVDDDETHLVDNISSHQSLARLRVPATGETAALRVGPNIVGRKAASSTADIQLTNDKYMSRRHVNIEVVKLSTGYQYRLVEIDSKNIVKLNGEPINRGDILVIKPGDIITLGTTKVTLD